MIMNFGNRRQRAARPQRRRVLRDAEGWRQALERVNIGPLKLLEEGTAIVPQSFEEAALPFGVERVESEGAFARPAGTGDDGKSAQRQIEVETVQVMRASPRTRIQPPGPDMVNSLTAPRSEERVLHWGLGCFGKLGIVVSEGSSPKSGFSQESAKTVPMREDKRFSGSS